MHQKHVKRRIRSGFKKYIFIIHFAGISRYKYMRYMRLMECDFCL